MVRRAITMLLWGLTIGLIAAGPTTLPTTGLDPGVGAPTSPRTAADWLARADRDLVRVVDGKEPDPFGRRYELAVVVYDGGPSDLRQSTAMRMIRVGNGFHLRSVQSRQARSAEFLAAAAALAEVHDLDGARQYLADADAPTTLPSDERAYSGQGRLDRAYTMLLLGETDRVADLMSGDDLVHVQKLEDAGRQQLADTLRVMGEQSEAYSTKWSISTRVTYLTDAGFYREAMATALGGKTHPQIAQWKQSIAEHAFQMGDRKAFRESVEDFLATTTEIPDKAEWVTDVYPFIEMAADLGEKDLVDQLGAYWETDERTNAAYNDADRLASSYVAVGEMDKFAVQIKRATNVLESMDKDPNATRDTRRGERADVAAAYARSGNKAAVDKLLAAMPDLGVENGQTTETLYRRVEIQYVRGGYHDLALKLAKVEPVENRDTTITFASRSLAEAGRFDEARKVAADLVPYSKVEQLYYIARLQARARKLDGMADWIDAVPSAEQRVILNLAVANELSGRVNRYLDGVMGVYRMFW